MGREIEIIDIHSESKARMVLEGHEERIRSLALMSRKTKIIAKSKKFGNSEIYQNTDFLISTGDDRCVRVWKIPPPLTTKQMQKIINEEDSEGIDEEEYCILNIQTRHLDGILSVLYIQESIATASRDGTVKVYNLSMKIQKRRPPIKDEEEDEGEGEDEDE